MTFSSLGSRRALAVATASALIPLGLVTAADAAPAPPTIVGPTGAVATNSPVLSWSRPSGAVKFQVEVDNTLEFSSPTVQATTVNTKFVPTKPLPGGTQHWRVQALDASGADSGWSTATITVSTVGAPNPVAPLTGSAPLAQPNDPPLLRWQSVQGATEYTVQVDKEADEVIFKEYKTKTTSLVVPDPLEATAYHWRVKATRASGVESDFSSWNEFTLTPLPDVTVIGPDNLEPVEDVELRWEPLPGAAWYEVEVAADQDFASVIDRQVKVLGTRYSPAKTYDNNQYFWRVRAVDPNGNVTPWPQDHASFTRIWPDTPRTVFPADADLSSATRDMQNLSEAPYFQWTPVQHATEYELQVGPNANFSPGTYESCLVAGTTYTPQLFWVHNDEAFMGSRTEEDCWVSVDTELYWRVRPLDLPFIKVGAIVPGVQGIFSEIEQFSWHPQQGSSFSPSAGETVDIPTLRWNFATGADRYRVDIRNNTGALVVTPVTTRATSYTPTNVAALDPTKGPFTWSVTAIDSAGPMEASLLGHPASLTYHNTFNLSGVMPDTGAPALTPLTGLETDGPTLRAPALSWEPMTGATTYKLFVGPADADEAPGPQFYGSTFEDAYGKTLPYPAVTDTGKRFLVDGRYDWWVQAFDANGAPIGTGPEETFEIAPLAPVTGQSIALDGKAIATGNGCAAIKPAICDNVPATPVFGWEPVEGASMYMVYVSDDASFTNVLEPLTHVAATTSTRWAPTISQTRAAFPDNVAGRAYHWFIRPCKAVSECGPSPISTPEVAINQFRKQSSAVAPITPDAQVMTSADITLDWADYYDTNQARTWGAAGEKSPQAAQWYRIEVDNDENFSSPLDSVLVDQSRFTSPSKLYPEGILWWRVQAVDAEGNNLPFSARRYVVKATPGIEPEWPANLAVVSGATHFEWKAQAAAAKYLLEVYKNDEISTATLLFRARVGFIDGVKQTAYTWDKPIPVASLPYVWRVSRIDPNSPGGNAGPPVVGGRFYSRGSVPSLLAPASNVYASHNAQLFSWSQVTGAASYQLELRASGAGFNWASIATAATAWAPDRIISDGTWLWRVIAKDAAGAPIGGTTWRTFKVDVSKPRVVSYTPTFSATPTTNVVVKVSEPVWNVSRSTFRIRRRGTTTWMASRVTISADRKTLKLNPTGSLRRGSRYVVLVSSGIRDARGNTLTAKTWTFGVR